MSDHKEINSVLEIVDTRLSFISIINGAWYCKGSDIIKIGSQIISYCRGSRPIADNNVNFTFTLTHNIQDSFSEIQECSINYLNLPIMDKPIFTSYKSNHLFSFYEKSGNNQDKGSVRLVIYGLNASSPIPLGVISNYNASKSLIHGKVMNSESEHFFDVGLKTKNIFYIAEPNIKNPDWTDSKKDSQGKNEFNISEYGNKNLYNQNWGETLDKFTNPRVYVWNFDSFGSSFGSDPYELDLACNGTYSIFSLKLLPNELGLVVNALENEPIKLGYKACLSRPSKIILYNLIPSSNSKSLLLKMKSEVIISSEDEYVRGVQILSRDTENIKECSILYFSIPSDVPNMTHWSSMQLCVQDLKLENDTWVLLGDKRICVPMQEEPADPTDSLKFKNFSGLFGSDIYKLIPLNGTNWIFTSTYVGTRVVPVAINIVTSKVCRIKLVVKDKTNYHGNMEIQSAVLVLETSIIYATVNLTSPVMPSLVMIIRIDSMEPTRRNIIYAHVLKSLSCFGFNSNAFPRSLIQKCDDSTLFNHTLKLARTLNQIDYFVFKEKHIVIRKLNHNNELNNFSKSPLLLYLHGGPHSVVTFVYSSLFTFLADIGYTILIPNYSGSLGFGDKYTKKLVHNILDIEIKEVISLTNEIKTISDLNIHQDLCFAIGGSYGGAMIYALVTQYPKFLTSAAAINGFTNALSFISCSDIPDYIFSEIIKENSKYQKNRISILDDKDTLFNLYLSSPISKVEKVITPLIIAIGALDNRVPISQSIEFYRALKKQGNSRVRMLYYPNSGHNIIQQDEFLDLYLNVVNWFGENNGIPFSYNNQL